MKKFYTPIFTAVFLLTSFLLQGQVYNSISSNPVPYTLDDPRFWVGPPPPNPCNSCTIKINSSVTMVHSGGTCCGVSSTAGGVSTTVFTGQTPSGTDFNDGLALTVGMRFQSSIQGNVTGARFFKTAAMGGTHTAVLYDNTGTVLAGPTDFTGETASGWQTQNFPGPFLIAANTTYVIAVFYSDGEYTDDNHFFTAAVTNNPLTAPQDVQPGGPFNDVYIYGAAPAFPTVSNGLSPNYWVDVNFNYTTDGPWLNDVVLNGSTINVYGNTTLSINTYVQLNGSVITIGNDPTSTEAISLNDQMDMDLSSSVQLANNTTYITSANTVGNIIQGPHDDFSNPGTPDAGIYSYPIPPVGGFNYSYVLNTSLIGYNQTSPPPPTIQFPNYALNCPGLGGCVPGVVNGPAITFQSGTTGPGNFYGVIFETSTTLPVQLVQFLATKNDNGTVDVSWATSQEQNSSYYDVERSGDQAAWTTIGTVKAKGYSSTTTNYSLTDQLPLAGTGYYRLKMVDLDGKYTYSKTVAVSSDNSSQPLVIYSNPFSDLIRLKVNVTQSQNLIMTVSDILGKTYLTQSYQAQPGDNFVNLQPNVVSSGMYILRIHGDSYDQTVKLEKQ